MKILLVSHRFAPDLGGIESVSEMLVEEFHRLGHNVRVLTWTRTQQSTHFPFPVVRDPSVATLFRAHLWADVVLENNPCLRLTWPNFFIRNPLVVVLHTWIPPGRAATLKKLWMQRAQSVLAVSKAIQTRCWPSATIIGNPYNDESFGARPEVEREHDFIFLGRLVSDKGVEIALRAFARLVGIDRTRIFTIVGDGPEHSSLERIAAELGITESVRFTGPLRGESLVRTLNAHRFLLVPSLWEEPFGIVALEGMACGCVPIVSDGGGLPDAVGKAGRIFRRGDVDALVEAMEEMLEEPEKAEALRREASTHLATYRIEIIAQRYLDAIMGATKSE